MSDETEPPGEPRAPSAAPRPPCLCMGLGPELTQLIAKLSGNDDVCQQVKSAWIEVLKGVQTLIDAHVASLTRESETKGTRLTVE
jgi:hypothetical protein